jgi:hypothetical protein
VVKLVKDSIDTIMKKYPHIEVLDDCYFSKTKEEEFFDE